MLADMERNSASFPDIAYTYNAGRSHFQQRLAVVSPDAGSLRRALAVGDVIRGVERPTRGKLAFLFTGQGSQWPGMCRELYDTSPVFRSALDECAGLLRLERPLLDVIYGPDGALLEQTGYSQPAIFAIEWSLARLWSSWGIETRCGPRSQCRRVRGPYCRGGVDPRGGPAPDNRAQPFDAGIGARLGNDLRAGRSAGNGTGAARVGGFRLRRGSQCPGEHRGQRPLAGTV